MTEKERTIADFAEEQEYPWEDVLKDAAEGSTEMLDLFLMGGDGIEGIYAPPISDNELKCAIEELFHRDDYTISPKAAELIMRSCQERKLFLKPEIFSELAVSTATFLIKKADELFSKEVELRKRLSLCLKATDSNLKRMSFTLKNMPPDKLANVLQSVAYELQSFKAGDIILNTMEIDGYPEGSEAAVEEIRERSRLSRLTYEDLVKDPQPVS